MPILSVNVDHVATLRQQRLGKEPDPVTAAHIAELAGAQGIIMHLREDRRHIQDRDVDRIAESVKTRFNFEMAATDEMRDIALKANPHIICLVPEKREELTTEGGLAVAGREAEIKDYIAPLHDAGIESSLFIEASKEQIEASAKTGCEYIEIHTGHYADAEDKAERGAELGRILGGIKLAQDLGLKVNLGHGLDYRNILAFAEVPGIMEYSIGYAIMARAIFTGLDEAVSRMADLIAGFVD